MDEPLYTIYTDGLCDPNPGGLATWGWVAYDQAGNEIAQDSDALGSDANMTNNRAEYAAVLNALEWADDLDAIRVLVRTDSELVVKQLNGVWAVKKPHLVTLHEEVSELLASVEGAIEWVPREQNIVADQLTRDAYSRARALHAASVRMSVYNDDPAIVQAALDVLQEKLGALFQPGKIQLGSKSGYMAYASIRVERHLTATPAEEDESE